MFCWNLCDALRWYAFRMRYKTGLGKCTLHHKVSPLQLDFSATAVLNDPTYHPAPMSSTIPLWPDPLSTWIKEAPRIEIRFSLRFSSALEPMASFFISTLERKLCISEVWSEIGLAVTYNTCDTHTERGLSTEHLIILELCKQLNASPARPSKAPAAPLNLADIPCPEDLPVVFLDSIEVFLDFDSSPFTHDGRHITTHVSDPETMGLRPTLDFSHPTIDWESKEPAFSKDFCQDEDLLCEDDCDPYFEPLYDLMEFGLQRLMISTTPEAPLIRIVGMDDLQLLRKLAPAIFNTDYREGMNQRAASIPSIADAVSSMLTKTCNPALQHHLSYLPWDPRAWIAKSLWGKAQAQLPRRKAPKMQRRFFPSNHSIPAHNEDVFSDILKTDGEEDGDFDFLQTDTDHEPNGPLSKSNSQISFQALHDATQTTLDSYPVSPSIISTSGPDEGSEMLFCERAGDLELARVESFSQLET